MQIEAGKILSKYLQQCHDIHGVQISIKYSPYINAAVKEIVLEALKEAAENADIYSDKTHENGHPMINKQSIISTIDKLKF